MAAVLQTALLDGSLALDVKSFTNDPGGTISVLKELQTQLLHYRSFRGEDALRVSAFVSTKICFFGKCGAGGRIVATMPDDLCIDLQICMFASAFVVQRRTPFPPMI